MEIYLFLLALIILPFILGVVHVIFDKYFITKTAINDLELVKNNLKIQLKYCTDEKTSLEEHWRPAFESFLAIDVETTGLKRASSRVIQIAIVHFDKGKLQAIWSTFIDPECKIPKNASKVNAIYDEDVKGKGNFLSHSQFLLKIISHSPLVGHNLYFDLSMIQEQFRNVNINVRLSPLYCTMRKRWYEESVSEIIKPKYETHGARRWQKLSVTADELGVKPIGKLHDAITDAHLSGMCFIAQARLRIDASQEKLLKVEDDLKMASAAVERAKTKYVIG